MPIAWIVTTMYCIGILSPWGQYALVFMLMTLAAALSGFQSVTLDISRAVSRGDIPAWLGRTFFLGLLFLVFGLASTILIVTTSSPGRRMNRGLQTFMMWLTMLTATIAATTRMSSLAP